MSKINLKHIGISSTSRQHAELFYKELLEFDIAYEFDVEAKLAGRIFNIENSFHVIMFERDGIFIEVFVSSEFVNEKRIINHFCIDWKNRDVLLERCKEFDVEVTAIDRGDRVTVFIKDYDGNLIEVKEQT